MARSVAHRRRSQVTPTKAHAAAPELAVSPAGLQPEVIDAESVPWMPFEPHSADVMVKYFRLDPVRGEMVMLVRARAGTTLPRVHQCGRTVIYTLEGRWKHREDDWIAGPGSVVLGPAASSHTLAVVADDAPVLVLAIVVGDLLLLGHRGEVLAIENWKTAQQRYLAYCARSAIAPQDLTRPVIGGRTA